MNKKIIHSVFEDAVEKFPNNTAIEFKDEKISYDHLNKKANQIAFILKDKGVEKGSIVGVLLKSSIDYVASLIGIFKAGAIFMPLDPQIPEKRFETILKQTTPKVIIKDKENIITPKQDVSVLYLNDMDSDIPDDNHVLKSDPDDGCYIMHTSGSTGEPKAILGRHKTVSHFMHWEKSEFELDVSLRVSQLSPETNDVIFRDVFTPLICGGTICIPDDNLIMNTQRLLTWLDEHRITLMHSVPSILRILTKEIQQKKDKNILNSLKYILLVGEELYGSDVLKWMDIFDKRIELVNLYGATETLAKSFFRIKEKPSDPHKVISVGNPMPNAALLILKNNQLCRPGEIGEIYIKTPFLTKGYYNNPEKTAQSFVQNPLIKDQEDIIYKTGDMGRYLPDRSIDFIGRLDRQVKINALRVELSEIETVLRQYEKIDHPLVIVHKTQEFESRLICYFTEKMPIDIADLREHMSKNLPEYMIPSFFVRLDEFPLNVNGKINKKALPQPEELIYSNIEYIAPSTDSEKQIAKIWEEILGIYKIGVNNPFFEIGGNSLNAIRIISRIYKSFEKELTIKEFFDNPTIKQLAGYIDQTKKSGFLAIPKINDQEYYDLSHGQKRLWVLDQMEESLIAYIIPGAYQIKGDLNVDVLRKAFDTLIERHESLRTIFVSFQGQPKQKILPKIDFFIEYIDVTDKENSDKLIKEYSKQESTTAFDLSKGPLIRAKLLRNQETHILLLNIHHIISDVWSLDILAREVFTLYKAYLNNKENPLTDLKIQYKDYAAWQLQGLENQAEHKKYWHEKLSGKLPVLDIQTDYPRPQVKTYNGEVVVFEINDDLTNGLKQIASKTKASLFMVLVSLVKTILYRYTAQEDIITGTFTAGRNHPDLEDQIGFYVNTLVLRDTVTENDTFNTLVEKVKDTTTKAYEHQSYPFDMLVEELDIDKDMSRSPVFDVSVLLQENIPLDTEMDNLEIIPMTSEHDVVIFDLDFVFIEVANHIEVNMAYITDLFKRETIDKLLEHLEKVITSVVDDPDIALSEIELSQAQIDTQEIEISTSFNF